MNKPNTAPRDTQAHGRLARARAIRAGGYSIVAILVVIAIAVFVNLSADRLPATYTKLDMTRAKLFELSDQTAKLLAGLTGDIDVYWISPPSQEDPYVRQLLEVYASLSPKVKTHKIDPVVYPNFAGQYTQEEVRPNSLVVVNGNRYKYVDFFTIYLYTMDYATNDYTEDWDGENALTSAIDFVTSDTLPTLYTLTGHGEKELSDTFKKSMTNQNMILKSTQLLSLEAVPEDADCLFIFSPMTDISEAEKGMILDFLARGGKLMLVSDYVEGGLPNLEAVMADYGAHLAEGILIEGNTGSYLGNAPYGLLPYIRFHTATEPLIEHGYRVLTPLAQGLVVESPRGTLTADPLLVTSDKAFSKQAALGMSTYEKEPGDLDGPFAVAAVMDETVGTTTTRLAWFTSSLVLDDSVNTQVSGANHDLVLNTLAWMNARENSISIHSKSLGVPRLVIPADRSTQLSVLVIGVIPLAVLAAGILVTLRRKRV